ncbi:MAG: YraN family protein [Acidimicrobiia bacterium]
MSDTKAIATRAGSTGGTGERFAASFLERHSCTIVDRNVLVDADELDLVMRHRGQLVVVEVKTSTNGDDPLEAVDETKFGRIERAAAGYQGAVSRIDLVGVEVQRGGVALRWLQGVR